MIICIDCNEEKSEEGFPYRNRYDGTPPRRQGRCSPCHKEKIRQYNLKQRTKVKRRREAEARKQRASGLKVCTSCNEEKPEVGFPLRKSRSVSGPTPYRQAACVECIRARQKEQNDRPENRVRRRSYLQSDQGKASVKKYRDSAKGQAAIGRGSARRRSKKLEQLCNCCDPREREEAYASTRAGHECYVCGDPASVTDHVIPLASGKPGDMLHCIENFRPICEHCNKAKGARVYPGADGWDDFVSAKQAR